MGRGDSKLETHNLFEEVERFGLDGAVESEEDILRREQRRYLDDVRSDIAGLQARAEKMNGGVSRRILVSNPSLLYEALVSEDEKVKEARDSFLFEAALNLMFDRGATYIVSDTRMWFSAFGRFDASTKWLATDSLGGYIHIVENENETVCGLAIEEGLHKGVARGRFDHNPCPNCKNDLFTLPSDHPALPYVNEDYFYSVTTPETLTEIITSCGESLRDILKRDLLKESGTFTLSGMKYGQLVRRAGEKIAIESSLPLYLASDEEEKRERFFQYIPDDHSGNYIEVKETLALLEESLYEAYPSPSWPGAEEMRATASSLPYLGRTTLLKTLFETRWPRALTLFESKIVGEPTAYAGRFLTPTKKVI
jgi:hypothetical protein